MDTASPPLTPVRRHMSPIDTSPTHAYREHLRRRTSSFSSHYDRSPASARKNRFSNASQFSTEFFPAAEDGYGAGNLADELDAWEDDLDADTEGTEEVLLEEQSGHGDHPSPADGARDSGIDVSYGSSKNSAGTKSFSKPLGLLDIAPDEAEEDEQSRLSPELEDALSNIARMASSISPSDDPLIPRTISLLQDLGNQSALEASTQRLTTSTNSMTSHLAAQSKSIQALAAVLYSPFFFSTPLDSELAGETAVLVEVLLKELPLPDPAPLQGMQKLDRETSNVVQTLSQLTDTLQIGRQTSNSASRHLRTTQTIVAELRRERERADAARLELGKTDWDARIERRWCADECKDILGGFESVCNSLRASLEQACTGATPA